jgi:hypothetical protein
MEYGVTAGGAWLTYLFIEKCLIGSATYLQPCPKLRDHKGIVTTIHLFLAMFRWYSGKLSLYAEPKVKISTLVDVILLSPWKHTFASIFI